MRSFIDVFGRAPKVLWVASSGGHVAQAHRIERVLGPNHESRWVTFDVPQTRSLLNERRVDYVDYVAPRDLKTAARVAKQIRSIEREEKFDYVVSTGSAIAFFALPYVALFGETPTVYVESLARSSGPSLTGRMMRLSTRVATYTQYESWKSNVWKYAGTILDSYRVEDVRNESREALNIFVTLGTIRPYRFDRLVDAVKQILAPSDNVVWQVGVTTRDDLPGVVHSSMSGSEMDRSIADADVVITHSGVGSILASFDHGKVPVVAVRQQAHSEHVDDHQKYIATVAESRGLSVRLDLDNPDRSEVVRSSRLKVVGNLNV